MLFEVDYSDSSSDSSKSEFFESESDCAFEDLSILRVNPLRTDVPKTKNYFEDTVPRINDYTFKSHFILNRK